MSNNITKMGLDSELRHCLDKPMFPIKGIEYYLNDKEFLNILKNYLTIGAVPSIKIRNIDEELLYKIRTYQELNMDEYYGFLFIYLFTDILNRDDYKEYFKDLSKMYYTNIYYALLGYLKYSSEEVTFSFISDSIYGKYLKKEEYIGNINTPLEEIYNTLESMELKR